MDVPKFNSPQEEIKFWKSQAEEYKERYVEAKEELDEFQMSSQELEAELEAALEQSESKVKDLTSTKYRLEMEVDSLREKLESLQGSSHKQISELEDSLAKMTGQKDELVRYIRELEQSNDDLERAKRATVVSLEDFEQRLNLAIERNAFLESELDDKESLTITVQRLKDEARDLRQEFHVRKKPGDEASPLKPRDLEADLEKIADKAAPVAVVDSNKLAEEMDTTTVPPPSATTTTQPPPTQTPVRPASLKAHTGTGTPLTPSTRISALNVVGDLLRKIGALENKLASCRNFVNNQPPRKSTGTGSPLNSPRAKRLHRGGPCSLQSDTQRPPSSSHQPVNVKITI